MKKLCSILCGEATKDYRTDIYLNKGRLICDGRDITTKCGVYKNEGAAIKDIITMYASPIWGLKMAEEGKGRQAAQDAACIAANNAKNIAYSKWRELDRICDNAEVARDVAYKDWKAADISYQISLKLRRITCGEKTE